MKLKLNENETMKKDNFFGLVFLILILILIGGGIYYIYNITKNMDWVDLLPFVVLLSLLIIVVFQILLYVRLKPINQPNDPPETKNQSNESFSSTTLHQYDTTNNEKVKFNDVVGLKNAKEECIRILRYLNDPNQFKKIGAKMPKGFIFEGPPGMGKTYLAKALANEAKVPFYYISAAELIELFVGVGAGRIRSIFHTAQKNKPCIIFIDELDAVAQKRSPIPTFSSGADEREQTINQLLACLDGVNTSNGIIIIAATNRIEVIDPAITRPGRFDSIIHVELTSEDEISKLINKSTESMIISDVVNISVLAQKMKEFSGAEIVTTCNRAALLAGDEGCSEISVRHFNKSIDFMNEQLKDDNSIDKIFQMAMNNIFFPKEKQMIEINTFASGAIYGQLMWISPDSVKLKTNSNGTDDNIIIPRGSIIYIKEMD